MKGYPDIDGCCDGGTRVFIKGTECIALGSKTTKKNSGTVSFLLPQMIVLKLVACVMEIVLNVIRVLNLMVNPPFELNIFFLFFFFFFFQRSKIRFALW